MKDTKGALFWIVNILKKHDIPYRLSGGFAAMVYGSTRELADIDIGIKTDQFSKIIPEIKEYIIEEPGFYKDSQWDLFASTLEYEGQKIDIVVIDLLKFFNKKENKWEDLKHTFSDIEHKEVYGVMLPIISKKNLIEYKSKLGREVDLIDINEMTEKI
ncbi:MAG: hypothetical protein KBB75_02410 [Candidatus Pacebacteria bacterium]|jgi:hypothetical protein|nr:hypothetical protein [Candidatus Paceibacterota bacterium]